MKDSYWGSALRSFIITFFGMIGLCVGLIGIILLLSLFSEDTASIDTQFSPQIDPNASGVRKSMSKDAPVVLVVDISGEIGTELLNTKIVRDMLVESREGYLKNDRVKAILLAINSPGGTYVDADGIYRALKAYKEKYKTPIYAYIDGLCASGGMYVAASADEIYATSTSIVGSVGVIVSSFFNASKLMEKVGLESLTLSAGKDKDELNPFRPWKPGEQDTLQGIVNYYYNDFVNLMTLSRPQINKTKLVEEYGAKVFPAPEGVQKGYIDGIVTSRDEVLKKLLAKISIEDDYYQVIHLESTKWWNTLIKGQSPLMTGKVTHELELGSPMLNPQLMNKFLLLYQP